jgi:uncharacterized protein YukE
MDPHIGDSPALRSHGAQLREAAERIDAIAASLSRRVDGSADYRGPAADRFRGAMADRTHRLRAVARDLQDLADVVQQDVAAGPRG